MHMLLLFCVPVMGCYYAIATIVSLRASGFLRDGAKGRPNLQPGFCRPRVQYSTLHCTTLHYGIYLGPDSALELLQ